jgi:hypothetical protein
MRKLTIWLFTLFLSANYMFLPFEAISAPKASAWQKATRSVESLKRKYQQKSKQLGWQCCLGTAYNEYMVSEHRCSILGRMLDKTKFIKKLESPQPNTNATAEDYALAAQSLDNWLYNLKNLQSLTVGQQVKTWNLDCAGKFEIPASEAISELGIAPTFYDVENEGTVLRVLGDVEQDFSQKLIKALNENPGVKVVALGSGGGLVREALLAGYEIRRRGLETTVWNNCYSACPLVFLGGTQRTVWSPYPSLGFHQIYDSTGALPLNSKIYSFVRQYANDMGVQSEALISLMLSAAPQNMTNANLDDLCKFKIATWVQRNCFSE